MQDPPLDGRGGRWALFRRIEEGAGWVAGLRCPGGAFGPLQYPTPPLRARTDLDRHANYILAAYMASGT